METEVAVIYEPAVGSEVPDDLDANATPQRQAPFELLEKVLYSSLLEGRKSAPASGLKGGYFLENGGQVHLEIFLRRQEDTPIFEVATPECRTPWDVVCYSKAFDTILDDVSRKSAEALTKAGWPGRLFFGKNNVDRFGTGFGCHENYLVSHRAPRSALRYLILAAPIFLLLLFPTFFTLLCVLLFGAATLVIGRLLPPLRRAAEHIYLWVRDGRTRTAESIRAIPVLFFLVIVYPPVQLYSLLLSRLAFGPFVKDLTSFLVSRQIYTGAGRLDFQSETFELSQRSRLTSSVAKIIMFGRSKTMFDLKGFLYSPAALFDEQKKLSITIGDSNLSDIPNLLKVGVTALLLEMIEAGETFAELRLKNPVMAFREIARGGPWKEVRLRSGQTSTAMNLQRSYLRRVKTFFDGRPQGRIRHREIIDLWEETLERLENQQQSLADSLDWVAKKSVLDQAVLSETNWKDFFSWGKLLQSAGVEAAARARDLGDLVHRSPFTRRRKLRRLIRSRNLQAGDFAKFRRLYFNTWKIDLRFHELGGSGYQRQLEREDYIRSLISPAAVALATSAPPPDTRARVRAHYIKTRSDSQSLRVNWNEVELTPLRRISLSDPFDSELPTESA